MDSGLLDGPDWNMSVFISLHIYMSMLHSFRDIEIPLQISRQLLSLYADSKLGKQESRGLLWHIQSTECGKSKATMRYWQLHLPTLRLLSSLQQMPECHR